MVRAHPDLLLRATCASRPCCLRGPPLPATMIFQVVVFFSICSFLLLFVPNRLIGKLGTKLINQYLLEDDEFITVRTSNFVVVSLRFTRHG